MTVIGIDFGAKRAGTTVACVLAGSELRFERCPKGEDADMFVTGVAGRWQPTVLGLDAPLSLPAIYGSVPRDPAGDYFYRAADRALGAMSPLFLGGLTARAIRLRDRLTSATCSVIEVYPAALRRLCGDADGSLEHAAAVIAAWAGLPEPPEPRSAHDVDSLLALVSVVRYRAGLAVVHGEASEGVIYV